MLSSPHRGAGPSDLSAFPPKQGMYNPAFEKDACGLAMVATLRGEPGHDIIALALQPGADVEALRIRVASLTAAFPLYPGLEQ